MENSDIESVRSKRGNTETDSSVEINVPEKGMPLLPERALPQLPLKQPNTGSMPPLPPKETSPPVVQEVEKSLPPLPPKPKSPSPPPKVDLPPLSNRKPKKKTIEYEDSVIRQPKSMNVPPLPEKDDKGAAVKEMSPPVAQEAEVPLPPLPPKPKSPSPRPSSRAGPRVFLDIRSVVGYHDVNNIKARELLQPHLGTNGYYLLRPSSERKGGVICTICVTNDNKLMNYRLVRDPATRKYYIFPHTMFPNIQLLLAYYKTTPINVDVNTLLLYPVALPDPWQQQQREENGEDIYGSVGPLSPATKDDSQIPGLHECLHTYMYVAPATKDDSQIPGLHEYLPKSGIGTVMNNYLSADGWYLLRPSSTSEGQLTLAVSHGGQILNVKINSEGDQFYIATKKRFNSVQALLDYYKTSPIRSKKYGNSKILLLNPIPVNKKQDMFKQKLKQKLEQKDPLPEPWQEHYGECHKRCYYYNPQTQQSSWERPKTPASLVQKPTSPSHEMEQTLTKRSQHLLNEALKAGCIKVITLVCIILGLPGVGKTLLKNLLLNKPPIPPSLRTSTTFAEDPVRIEIRNVTGTRVRNEQGKWKEVDDDGMLDAVATMICSIEPEQILGESTTSKAKHEPRESISVFPKIVNWVSKHNKKDEATGKDSPEEKSVAIVSVHIASSSSLEACQKAMKKIMDKLVQRINKLKGREHSADPIDSLSGTTIWVYFTDSGGQPQYHELLPLFVRNISSALCVTRLTDKLDEVQVVEYYQGGEKVGASQHSQLSTKDTIQCLVNTIQSYSTQEMPPKIIMVGTHLDLLEKQLEQSAFSSKAASSTKDAPTSIQSTSSDIETLEEKDKKLLDMLEPEFLSQLVYSSSDLKKLLFTINALNPGEHEENVAQLIRHSVETSEAKEVKVPIRWYVLELLLRELAKELGRGVLSRAECLEMARLLSIEEDSFNAALEFLNKLNVIKYTPDVLPDVVFVDSQIPLNKISELVQCSYQLRQPPTSESSSAVEGVWKQFRDQGVVSEECLEDFPKHYVPGIFTKEHLSKLLTSLLVLAEIPPPVKIQHTKPQKYFVMPALLETLLEDDLECHRVSCPSIAPLLVRFPERSRRAGVFCCFVVHLIRDYGWKLLLDSKEPLYRNCIKLQFLTSPPSTIMVIDSNTYIEVHVDITAQGSPSEYANTTTRIRQAILDVIHGACIALSYKETVPELTFFCPHTDHPKETKQHTVTITPDRRYWRCDLTPRMSGPLQPHHMIWFEDSCESFSTASLSSGGKAKTTTGANLPHIAEYISIGNTKDEVILDSSKPTSANLTVIRWKNKGQEEKFKLKSSIVHKWRKIGNLVVPRQKLEVWAKRMNDEECCEAVLSCWLDHPPRRYPATWKGLYELLDDCELGQVAIELKQAVDNAI